MNGSVSVQTLSSTDVDGKLVADINKLLKEQHQDSEEVSEKSLLDSIKHSKVAVALLDGHVVGVAVLITAVPLSHTYCALHNLVVKKNMDTLAIGVRLVDELMRNIFHANFIDADSHEDDKTMLEILRALGFTLRKKRRHRKMLPIVPPGKRK